MKKIEAVIFFIIAVVVGVLYVKKVIPFDAYTTDSVEFAVNVVWGYFGWCISAICALCGFAAISQTQGGCVATSVFFKCLS